MLNRTRIIVLGLIAIAVVLVVVKLAGPGQAQMAEQAKPALTVTTVSPAMRNWPQKITATGNVQAWQEAIVGAQVAGLRLAEVDANVGDAVKKGQQLARFEDEMVLNELDQQHAAVAEARARGRCRSEGSQCQGAQGKGHGERTSGHTTIDGGTNSTGTVAIGGSAS